MKNPSLGLSLLAGLGVLISACGSDGGSSNGCPTGQVACDGVCIEEIAPTLDGANGIQAAVFGVSCAAFSNCHGTEGFPQADLELSSVAVSEQQLIDVASTQVPTSVRVDPGDSTASYLMNKLLGVDIGATQQMPPTGMLCEARLEAVRDWIDAGAPIQ